MLCPLDPLLDPLSYQVGQVAQNEAKMQAQAQNLSQSEANLAVILEVWIEAADLSNSAIC